MGDDEHLIRGSEAGEGAAHGQRGLTSDAGIDLVEHQRRRSLGHDEAEREHRASELSAGRNLGERRHVLTRVRREAIGHGIAGVTVDVDLETGARQRELDQVRLHHGREQRRRSATRRADPACLLLDRVQRRLALRVEHGRTGIVRRQHLEPRTCLVPVGDDLPQRLAVLADELAQQLPASAQLGETFGILHDLLGRPAQLDADVGGLGLEAVKPRLDLRERRPTGERGSGRSECVDPAAVTAQRLDRACRRLTIRDRIGEPVLLDLERAILVGIFDAGSDELVHLIAEEVDLPGSSAVVAAQRGQLGLDLRDTCPGCTEPTEVDASEPIERTRAAPRHRATTGGCAGRADRRDAGPRRRAARRSPAARCGTPASARPAGSPGSARPRRHRRRSVPRSSTPLLLGARPRSRRGPRPAARSRRRAVSCLRRSRP